MFTSKREDGRADWRVVYDYVTGCNPGDLITFNTLGELLDTDKRHTIYGAVSAANHRLWAREQRSLGVVKGVGYRVLRPQEHELQATSYQVRSRRQMSNAVAVMDATDLTAMTPAERERTLAFTGLLTSMLASIADHEHRIARHDQLIRQLQEKVGLDPDPPPAQ